MKTSTSVGIVFAAIVLVTASIFFEAALLGLILSWFNVYLTFWQNLAIVVLANMIFKNTGSSAK
jgi:hypothetical protein